MEIIEIPPGKFGGGTVSVGGVGGGFLGNVLGGDANGADQEKMKCGDGGAFLGKVLGGDANGAN
ncbi:hypothetical protein Ccrd_003974, partial [Cynara cardunculus var. scolymus]